MKIFSKRNVGIAASSVILSVPGLSFAQDSTVVFGGLNSQRESNYLHVGAVHALNGDLGRSGWLLRFSAGIGEYDYQTTAVAGGHVDGDHTAVQAGLGYQWVSSDMRFSLYGSFDHRDHDLTPDDVSNSVRGDKTGASVQAELQTLGSGYQVGVIGQYSSVFDSYWARGRLGFPVGGVRIGPEAIFDGNKEYDSTRGGVFVGWPLSRSTTLDLSVGYATTESKGSREDVDGAYGAVNFSFVF